MEQSKIPFYFINSSLVDKINKERKIKLNSEHILIISIVNSFSKVGKKCSVTQSTFASQLGCSKSTLRRRLNDLVDNKIIRIYYPKNQAKNHKSCITHLHKDVKVWIRELAEGYIQVEHSLNTGAISKLNTNNKNIGKEESSFRNDSSFQPEGPELACLNFLAD